MLEHRVRGKQCAEISVLIPPPLVGMTQVMGSGQRTPEILRAAGVEPVDGAKGGAGW